MKAEDLEKFETILGNSYLSAEELSDAVDAVRFKSATDPSHYKLEGRKECWDEFLDKYGIDFTIMWCLMTADKYLYRAGHKKDNSFEQDLAKTDVYLNHAKELMDVYSLGYGGIRNYLCVYDTLRDKLDTKKKKGE